MMHKVGVAWFLALAALLLVSGIAAAPAQWALEEKPVVAAPYAAREGVPSQLGGSSVSATLTQPSNVRAVSQTAGELTLMWEGGDNAHSYVLIAVHMGTFDYETANIADGAARSGTVTGLTEGERYLGIVVALQVQGDGSLETLYGSAAPVPVQAGDRAVLVALYNATGGASWTDNTNWLSSEPIGEWYGVTTDANGRVTELSLGENALTGTVPSSLGHLSELTELGLYRNQLSGEIPPSLGNLSKLTELYLLENQLTGSIPTQLGNLSNLTILFLYDNQLTGRIPPSLSNLTRLERLSLRDNQLNGEIPSWLGELSRLTLLRLDGNDLRGEIPTELGNLSRLEVLELGGNELEGSIPPSLGDLANLTVLNLWGNRLGGEIPPALGTLANLTRLRLHENDLTGEIPTELGNLTNLERLNLGGNELEGDIPSELQNLSKLEELYLWENQLAGTIPTGLGNLSNLRILHLGGNDLDGDIPSELQNLSKLEELRLWENGLTGTIPTGLGNLSNLTYLNVGGNELDGDIPSELQNLSKLEELYLWGNNLDGSIPVWLGSMTTLQVLHLGDNELDGNIPLQLQNLINLVRLDVGTNKLSGTVPTWLGGLTELERLSLTNNRFMGTIPSQLGNLTKLQRLSLSRNQLTGEIPASLGNLVQMERLWLYDNQLTGEIPASLSNLTKLTILRVAGTNQFTGCIPAGLSNVADNDLADLGLLDCHATRGKEYSHSIIVSDDWVQESEGRYNRTSPWSHLEITSLELGNSVTLAQYATWIRDGLKGEWWESSSLFEITSFQEEQINGQDFYSITYRVQEGPEYCVVDVSELVTVSNALPGSQHGYRVRMWMCEGDAVVYGRDRLRTLHSFRVTTQPSRYYGHFLSVKDVVIKAKDTVDPDALYAAGDIVSTMLSGRRDIADCMANVGAGLAIIPKDEYVTTLPEFSHLIGTSDFTGRPRDSFAIRGLGAVKGQPVSATSEEQLLGLPTDQYPHNRFPHIGFITVHEFAHGIQNLCFTQNDWEQWEKFYDAAKQAGIFPGTHMMHDVYEFFAVLSTAYFEVTDEIGRGAGRSTVESDFPEVFESLEEIYGGAVLAAEYRERKF